MHKLPTYCILQISSRSFRARLRSRCYVDSKNTHSPIIHKKNLFSTFNTNQLNRKISINIISNITNYGAYLMNQWNKYYHLRYKFTIQPNGTTLCNLSGISSIPGYTNYTNYLNYTQKTQL